MAGAHSIGLDEVIERQRLGRFQLGLAALLCATMFVDGFEAQAPGFAAPAIIADFHIPRAAMGLVFGAGNLGLLIGAIVLGILGDRIGRKRAIVFSCAVLAVFSFATMAATDLTALRLLRIGSGLGVGGVLPSVIALGSEYSPKKYQATAVWFLLIGYQAGASSGALVSAFLIPTHGWQAMFLAGGILPIIAGGLAAAFLPESVRYLALAGATHGKAIAILRRMEPALALPDGARLTVCETAEHGFRLSHLFAEGRAGFTAILWFVYAANLMALQFLLTWLPTVLESETLSREFAAAVTVLVPLGGIAGGLVLGLLLDKGNIRPLAIAFALGVPMVALIGSAADSPVLLVIAAFGAGCAIIGGQTNINSIAGRYYPTFIRANGVGWANGAGRLGSVLGPVIGGFLIGLDLPNARLFLFAAVPPACAALGSFALARLSSQATLASDPLPAR